MNDSMPKSAIKIVRPAVIIVRDGKILLALSKYGDDSFYLCPGGSLEGFESLDEAAMREVKEETNCEVKLGDLLYVREWINESQGSNVLDVFFLGELLGNFETHLFDPCKDKGVIQKLEWISIDKLHTVDFEPKMLIPHIQKDFPKKFKGRTVYVGHSP